MLLDTNIVSEFLRPAAATKAPKIHAFVEAQLRKGDLAISYVTQFELRRGIEKLVRQGGGRRKLVEYEKFVDQARVLGLDDGGGAGWNLAAELWALGATRKPARNFSEADLLVAATAAFHNHEFATCDVTLAEGLRLLSFPAAVRLIERE